MTGQNENPGREQRSGQETKGLGLGGKSETSIPTRPLKINRDNLIDAIGQARSELGLVISQPISDGRLHRCPVEGGRPGNLDGAYKINLDPLANVWAQNFKTGAKAVFSFGGSSDSWSPAERREFAAKVEEDRRRREADQRAAWAAAASKAERLYDDARPCSSHPYLTAKGVSPHFRLRVLGPDLAVPLCNSFGLMRSLQFIAPDGQKRFLKGGQKSGCYLALNTEATNRREAVLICEGLATGLSLFQSTGLEFLVAFDAGNLKAVALALTAKQAGEGGNDIDLRLSYQDEDLPGGLQIEITPLSGGAGNPDPAEVIAALGSERFQVIAWPWVDKTSLDALKTELDLRWGPTRQNDGQAVVVKTGAYAEVTTFASGRNDRHLTVLPGEGSPTLSWVDCAASCAILAYYAADDPARPFQTLAIPGVLAPARKDRWIDFPEKEQALYEGVSARGVNDAGQVVFLNVITTCRTNEWGAETEAYLSLNTLFTLSYLRQDWNNRLRLKYPRYKLADDEAAKYFTEGQPVMTPKLGRAEAIACYRDWVGRGLVESVSDFEHSLVVERDQNNPNRLNWVMSPDLINQFRIGATVIRFLL